MADTESLNFSMVANNDVVVEIVAIRSIDNQEQDLTGFSIIWQMFTATGQLVLTKTTAAGKITILDQTTKPGAFQFQIDASDTKPLTADANYIHEPVLVDSEGNAVTGTNPDLKLTPGQIYLRRQRTVQT